MTGSRRCGSRRGTAGTALPPAGEVTWWCSRCRFNHVFLMDDSAGATIAFHIAARLGEGELGALAPLFAKGAILIKPFFGGEARTALVSLSTSENYWHMALHSRRRWP
ncbi:hypothetical protein QYE76_027004 [Lolium multiflorum]|uniref:Uncharacterized protein n=1 Tax=Lolium multiflorum TaxID=4521 RepID=A0AAD8VE89_LOLMU|nr:hypothetical protein QYE76_027004 [Lolium multiflorum]